MRMYARTSPEKPEIYVPHTMYSRITLPACGSIIVVVNQVESRAAVAPMKRGRAELWKFSQRFLRKTNVFVEYSFFIENARIEMMEIT